MPKNDEEARLRSAQNEIGLRQVQLLNKMDPIRQEIGSLTKKLDVLKQQRSDLSELSRRVGVSQQAHIQTRARLSKNRSEITDIEEILDKTEA